MRQTLEISCLAISIMSNVHPKANYLVAQSHYFYRNIAIVILELSLLLHLTVFALPTLIATDVAPNLLALVDLFF